MYVCPITKEIFTKPISLPCGHSFEHDALLDALRVGTGRRCPLCKTSVPSSQSSFSVNIVLRDTVRRLYPAAVVDAKRAELRAALMAGPSAVQVSCQRKVRI